MPGERFASRQWNNWVTWTVIALLFAFSFVLAAQVVAPKLLRATV